MTIMFYEDWIFHNLHGFREQGLINKLISIQFVELITSSNPSFQECPSVFHSDFLRKLYPNFTPDPCIIISRRFRTCNDFC